MISKFRFSMIAVIMLVLLGFGFQNQAQGQVGDDGLFCPAVPNTTGWLNIDIDGPVPLLPFPEFSGGLIGTVDSLIGGPLHGGMDWMHRTLDIPFDPFDPDGNVSPTPTNQTGSQLVSWWTQKDGRNTYIQVTNLRDSNFVSSDGTWVHVHIFGEDCVELRDFCDFYTVDDTHVYNFGDLVSNRGVDEAEGNLQGREGFVTITAVNECPADNERAIDHDYLAGNTFVRSVSTSDYMYGFATYHRRAVCDATGGEQRNLIGNGSFQNGNPFDPWSRNEGDAAAVVESDITGGAVSIPPAVGPDADNPNSNLFMGFAVSTGANPTGVYDGGPFPALAVGNEKFIKNVAGAFQTNVTVVTSNTFTPTVNNTVFYDLAFLAPGSGDPLDVCDNFAAVCLIETSTPTIVDCECYNIAGVGNAPDGTQCQSAVGNLLPVTVTGAGGNFNFFGGNTAFFNDSLGPVFAGTSYAVQMITGQTSVASTGSQTPCSDNTFPFFFETGAFGDNFRVVEDIPCDGILTGAENAMLDIITPLTVQGQFDAQTGTAGGDAVLINFFDDYGPPYTPAAAFINAVVSIWNDVEDFTSCGNKVVCFERLGIDEAIVLSENFAPTAPPTTPPTLGPTTQPPTQPPTNVPGGGSGSCAIAGNPVQLGTAFANVLIPLVPVAFVFGIRAMRRRKK